jgi:hypothetical protein
MSTAYQLQDRLSPKTIARNTWEGAKIKGADLAEDAVDAVRSRPFAVGGAVAAIAMFLAREPLMDLAGKVADGVKKKRTTTTTGSRRRGRAPAKHTETEAAE